MNFLSNYKGNNHPQNTANLALLPEAYAPFDPIVDVEIEKIEFTEKINEIAEL
jgi:hypothetical protein